MRFVRVHIGAQHGIDARLVAPAGVLEEVQHVGIDAQRDLLLGARKLSRLGPDRIGQVRGVAVVDLLIRHCGHGGQPRFLCVGERRGILQVKRSLDGIAFAHWHWLPWQQAPHTRCMLDKLTVGLHMADVEKLLFPI